MQTTPVTEPDRGHVPGPSRRGTDLRGAALAWVGTALRMVLGGVALVAGVMKIVDLPGSVRAVRAYELLPDALAVLAGNALPMIEIVVGLLLVTGLFTRWSAVLFGALMLAFSVGVASAWARGLTIDCGCFGGGGQVEADETRYLHVLVRDVALVLGAAWLVWRPRTRLSLDRGLGLDPLTRTGRTDASSRPIASVDRSGRN
ncbi:DoxX family protein [Cellulomonas bogoriensis]|uniref:DoxX family protein n=1 Tax=Cellulomonas bogoriensis 69B4 = DSM 16987 TaxID=1386082 RepID=A0A0A0BL54_9CELL|nr:DoxX family protein [Cellulomonas bogoriensis]KGM08605.1 DoxX family protein [Cellulomonas bogoriensis 69B4 = DSM 16987]